MCVHVACSSVLMEHTPLKHKSLIKKSNRITPTHPPTHIPQGVSRAQSPLDSKPNQLNNNLILQRSPISV